MTTERFNIPRKNLSPPLRGPRHIVLIVAATIALIAAGWFFYTQFFATPKVPTPGALQNAVAQKLTAQHGSLYTVAAFVPGAPVSASTRRTTDERLLYNATATARLSEPLYEPVNASDFIAREMKLDTSATRKIESIVAGPGGARIRELAGIDSTADSLASMRLVRETARTGQRYEFRANIEAERAPDGWRINILSFEPQTPLPPGDVLAYFSGHLFDVTRESDLATIRRLVAQSDETLRRVEQARDHYRSELAANATRVIATSLTQLAPGSLFTGKISQPPLATNAKSPTTPAATATPEICLEIITLDRATNTLTAQLRAESSWTDARLLDGRYAYDASTGIFTLTLTARKATPLVSGATRIIPDATAFTMILQLAGTELTGAAPTWICKLTRTPDISRAQIIATYGATEQKLLHATRPGAVYRVRTNAKLSPPDETSASATTDHIVRIQKQDTNQFTFTANMENMQGVWMRELHGAILTDGSRANGFPVRLVADPSDKKNPSLKLALKLNERASTLSGTITADASTATAITLTPADKEYLAQLPTLIKARDDRKLAAEKNAREKAEFAAAVAKAGPFHPTLLPTSNGGYILDGNTWRPLPANNAQVVRSTLQKVGGLWSSAVSLIKTRPDKQDVGTLTFDGADAPPAVSGSDVTLLFRGTFPAYAGAPVGKPPIEVAPLEIKSKGRKRVAELDRLGDAAATFGKVSVPLAIEQPLPNIYIIKAQKILPVGRYTLHAPEHPFEFEVK